MNESTNKPGKKLDSQEACWARYLTLFSVGFLLTALISVALFYAQLGNPTATSEWAGSMYAYKNTQAGKIKTKKVVIVSGSNGLFGMDSARLSQAWDMPVINQAVHAGLQLPYILHQAKAVLRQGDIALLPLEFELYSADSSRSEVFIDYVVSRDPDYFSNMSLLERLNIIVNIHPKRILQGLIYNFTGTISIDPSEYSVANINKFGDQINLEPEKMTPAQHAKINLITPRDFSGKTIASAARAEFTKFSRWADRSEVCLIIVPPVFVYFDQFNIPETRRFFQSMPSLAKGTSATFVGDPYDYMYSKQYYFNSGYHLNSNGTRLRLRQLLEDLGSNPYSHCPVFLPQDTS